MQAHILVSLLEELFAHLFSIQVIKNKIAYLMYARCNCVAHLKCHILLLEIYV